MVVFISVAYRTDSMAHPLCRYHRCAGGLYFGAFLAALVGSLRLDEDGFRSKLGVTVSSLLFIYFFGRIALFVLTFISLRAMSPGAYKNCLLAGFYPAYMIHPHCLNHPLSQVPSLHILGKCIEYHSNRLSIPFYAGCQHYLLSSYNSES
jgi:hypothetical protein